MPRKIALTCLTGSRASMPQMVVKRSPVKMEWSRMQGMTRYWERFVRTDKTSISMEIMRAARETLTLVENHLKNKDLESHSFKQLYLIPYWKA